MSYGRFATMIVTSTVIMFGLMYLNTYGPRSRYLQPDQDVDGATDGRGHGDHHDRLHVVNV